MARALTRPHALDLFLWGHLKSKVYVNKPNNLVDLKERIRIEMANITPHKVFTPVLVSTK